MPKEDSSLGLQCLEFEEEEVGLEPYGLWDLLRRFSGENRAESPLDLRNFYQKPASKLAGFVVENTKLQQKILVLVSPKKSAR